MGKMKNIAMDDVMDEAARLLAQEIDRELMESIEAEHLMGNGWRESPLRKPWGPFSNWEAETAQWCHLHCTGDYKYVLSHWWFENPADATAFTLRFA
jgi:hypothetical protein